MKKFEKPKSNIINNSNDKYGKFEIEPLERGFGTTLGNALRRVLLSSLPGASVFSVEIDGARHEFAALDGIEEDVTSIILNLKGLVLTIDAPENETVDLKINVKGPCEITGADIECPLGVEVLSKDLHIANVAAGGEFNATLHARNGRGYVTAENNSNLSNNNTVGVIYTDSKYSPVENVAYNTELTRVGNDVIHEKLTIEVWTNGGIKPQEAISLAAHILIAHLNPIVELETKTADQQVMTETKEEEKNEFLDRPIEDLNLSIRSLNGLKRANYALISEITDHTEEEMSKIRNLGKKSIKEIKEKLIEKGLNFKSYE